jgi:hypothetical protein
MHFKGELEDRCRMALKPINLTQKHSSHSELIEPQSVDLISGSGSVATPTRRLHSTYVILQVIVHRNANQSGIGGYVCKVVELSYFLLFLTLA